MQRYNVGMRWVDCEVSGDYQTPEMQPAEDGQWVRYAEVEKLESLREQGYLVLAPGDTSPLGELVRAAVAVAEVRRLEPKHAAMIHLLDASDAVEADPAIAPLIEAAKATQQEQSSWNLQLAQEHLMKVAREVKT